VRRVVDDSCYDRALPAEREGRLSQAGRERAIGAGLALGFLALYLATMCRAVYWYDSAEYAAAAYVLGIPHPPGYPLYTIIGHLFTFLPVEPAVAVNAMSAVFAAVAVGLGYGLVRELGAGRLGAAVGAAALGGSRLFWSQAVIAEVYTPAVAALTAVTWLVVRGRRQDRPRLIVAGALLAGLGLGLHLSIATAGVGLALLVGAHGCDRLGEVFSRRRLAERARLGAAAAGATVAGSLVFLYLPLRARMEPALNFGDPSTWDRFVWHVTGGNYAGWFGGIDRVERAGLIAGLFYDQLLVAGIALAAAGAWACARRSAVTAVALGAMAAGNLYYFFDYRVHDIEVFFLPSIAVACWLVGLGADWLRDRIAARSGSRSASLARAAGAALALFPALLLPANCEAVDRSQETGAEEFGRALVDGLPRGAVLVNFTTPPEWKADAVFGFYYQKAMGERPDVRVLMPRSPAEVTGLLRRGVPVYLYAPVAPVVRLFEIAPDGPLYRVLRPRGRGGVSRPGAGAAPR
jgi:hypothetical protein